jgi:hypothetical protein
MTEQPAGPSSAMAFRTVLDRLLTMVEVNTQLRDTYADEIEDLQLAIEQVLVALKLTLENGSDHGVTDALQIALARVNHAQSLHDAVKDDAIRHDQVMESLQVLLRKWWRISSWATPRSDSALVRLMASGRDGSADRML